MIVLESRTWYPQQKLDLAKQKLEGANPVTITTEELKAGFNNSKYLTKYLDCVKGHNSTRGNMRPYHLSPEEQVGMTRCRYCFSNKMWYIVRKVCVYSFATEFTRYRWLKNKNCWYPIHIYIYPIFPIELIVQNLAPLLSSFVFH